METILTATPPIPLHTFTALLAIILGAIQMLLPKGTTSHRWMGRCWVGLLAIVALSSFFIFENDDRGNFSMIHLLSVVTLIALWRGVYLARRGDIKKHRFVMMVLFYLALILTGLFTFLPGRLMHDAFLAAPPV